RSAPPHAYRLSRHDALPISPSYLDKVQHIQRTGSIPKIKFTCLCDVRNPFLGVNGAVPIFGPQKGIEPDQLDCFGKSCERILELDRKSTRLNSSHVKISYAV